MTLVGDPVTELSGPIGVLVVAVAVALHHGVALRRDQALRATIDAEPTEEPMAVAATLVLRLWGRPAAICRPW